MSLQLQQKKGPSTLELTLGDETLNCRHTNKGMNEEWSLRYGDLAENPSRLGVEAPTVDKEIVAGVVLTLIFGIPAILWAGKNGAGVLFIPLFLAIGLTIWKFRQLRTRSFDVWQYFDKKTGGTALTMNAALPDEITVAEFRAKLDDRIKKHSFDPTESSVDSMAAQIHQLDKLFKSGALSESEFETAKKRLLSEDENPREIGFQTA